MTYIVSSGALNSTHSPDSVIPHTCSRKQSRCAPEWSEHVQPLREKSIFWHRLWVECGRPHVADCMRRSRAAYHYAIQRIRKNEADIVRDRIAESMLNNKSRNFWSEIKHIRSHSASSSKTVDCISDSSSISKLFADKYRELYTCVSYNESDMQHIIQDVNNMVTEENSSGCFRFRVCDIRTAVGYLKPQKRDGCIDLSSDHSQELH